MRLLCLFLLIFWLPKAECEIIFSGVPLGVSEYINFNANDADNGFEIAGGITNAICSATSSTCNSCVSGWIQSNTSCNERQISPSTEFSLTLTSTSEFGNVRLTTITNNTEDFVNLTVNPAPTTAINQPITVRATWSSICDKIVGGDASCGGAAGFVESQTFKVGIDGNNDSKLDNTTEDDYVTFTLHIVNTSSATHPTPPAPFATPYTTSTNSACASGGFCDFTLSKGDEKAYISDLRINPSGLDTTYKQVIFFCAQGTDPSLIDSACTDKVAITGTNSLANDTIEDMTNGVEYIFRAATVDIAGNIGLFLNIDRTVRPDDVVGLFEENSCFIATAAYGSPLEKHVKVLRSFRDRVLLQSGAGQLFVKAYYTLSPPLAKWIARSPLRRSAARILLTPIVLFTTLAMEAPWLFCFFNLLIFSGFLVWVRQRRGQLT